MSVRVSVCLCLCLCMSVYVCVSVSVWIDVYVDHVITVDGTIQEKGFPPAFYH